MSDPFERIYEHTNPFLVVCDDVGAPWIVPCDDRQDAHTRADAIMDTYRAQGRRVRIAIMGLDQMRGR